MENMKVPTTPEQVNAVIKSSFRGKTQARGKSYSQRSQQTEQTSMETTADMTNLHLSLCQENNATTAGLRTPKRDVPHSVTSVLDAGTRTIRSSMPAEETRVTK